MTLFLFAGDSVTDCGRTFFDPAVEAGELGDGWVRIVASLLDYRQPQQHTFLNAGVAGDRVYDLQKRWDRDVARFEPEVLTVLVGVNDSLREPPTHLGVWEETYAELLNAVPDSVRLLVLAEPFVLSVNEGSAALRDVTLPRIELVRSFASSYEGAVLLPLDHLFQDACTRAAPAWWAPDGVHPSAAGNGLIAEAWLQTVASSS